MKNILKLTTFSFLLLSACQKSDSPDTPPIVEKTGITVAGGNGEGSAAN